MPDVFEDPIEHKLRFWIEYEKNLPQIPYKGNEIFFDEYRKLHDLDCQFLGGNLSADTIFSLWEPLRLALITLNDTEELESKLGIPRKRQMFLQKFLNSGIDPYLPPEHPVTQELRKLFFHGQGRENVMLLSNRGLNEMRSVPPYHDYMPYFLVECFKGGKFAHIFNQDEGLLRFWLQREELQDFFEDRFLVPEAVLDLSGSGDVRNHLPPPDQGETALLSMFQKYNFILTQRWEALLGNNT